MRCPRLMKTMIFPFWVFVCLLGHVGLICESAAQGPPSDSPSETPQASESKRPGKVVPFAGYEERLRQSSRWQSMTSEEQVEALEKIGLARKKILERQQQLQTQYEDQIKKMKKPRESLMSKRRRKQGQYQDGDSLWSRFQALPVEERLYLERQLGLDQFLPSQKQKKFQDRLEKLSYSERNDILYQIQRTSP